MGEAESLTGAEVERAAQEIRTRVAALAASTDPAAFRELLALSEQLGLAIGESARNLAASGSWSRVAEQAGTTKQAAWSRWH